MIFPDTEVEADRLVAPRVFLFTLFKNGHNFPFFQSPGISSNCRDFSNIMDSGLGKNFSQFPQDSWMHLVRSHRLTFVQVPQVVTNLIFSYSGRDFASPIPVLWSIHSRGVGREVASEDSGKRLLSTSAFSPRVPTSLLVLLSGFLTIHSKSLPTSEPSAFMPELGHPLVAELTLVHSDVYWQNLTLNWLPTSM